MEKSEKIEVIALSSIFVILIGVLAVLYISTKINYDLPETTPETHEVKSMTPYNPNYVVSDTESIKIEIPVSVTVNNDVEIRITKPKDTYNYESRKEYITNLRDYQGNVDFKDVYDCAKHWCNVYDNDLDYFLALMYVESNYKTTATSDANCRGLVQVGHDALDQFNAAMWAEKRMVYLWSDMYDYEKNIEVSCWYLDWLWRNRIPEVGDSTRKYIQSYNYGRSGVKKCIMNNEYSYADKIIALRDTLKAL